MSEAETISYQLYSSLQKFKGKKLSEIIVEVRKDCFGLQPSIDERFIELLEHDCDFCAIGKRCKHPDKPSRAGLWDWDTKEFTELWSEKFWTCSSWTQCYEDELPEPKQKVTQPRPPSPLKGSKRPGYHRLNVFDYIDEFCGWDTLQELLKYAPKGIFDSTAPRDFIITAFKTGGRANEVLHLGTDNFSFDNRKKVVKVSNMSLLKHYIRLKSPDPTTQKMTRLIHAVRRPFSILQSEPLSTELTAIVQSKQGLLFQSPYNEKAYSSSWAWLFLRNLSDKLPKPLFNQLGLNRPFIDKMTGDKIADSIHLWVHWFRSQRATELREDYHFNESDLMQWFGWQDLKTAMHYSHISDESLIEKMRSPERT